MSKITFTNDFAHHPTHYFVLLCILVVGLWGIFWFDYFPAMRMSVMISMAAAYVTWGVVHHSHHRNLHPKIVVEYVLMAVLAVLVFASLLYIA